MEGRIMDYIPDWLEDSITKEYLDKRAKPYKPRCTCDRGCEDDCLCECHQHGFNNERN